MLRKCIVSGPLYNVMCLLSSDFFNRFFLLIMSNGEKVPPGFLNVQGTQIQLGLHISFAIIKKGKCVMNLVFGLILVLY